MNKEDNHIWLNRDQIIEKFYNSKSLLKKMDAILLRCGISRINNILEDCIASTFLELCRMSKEKIEDLYNGKMKKTFEGFIINIFKNVCIKTSNDNPKGSVVSHILHASSLNSNGSISPTENSDDVELDSYHFIQEDKPPNEYSQNNLFNHVLDKLDDNEKETLELLINKKDTAGRYKREVKQKMEKLKSEIKEYMIEFDESYKYINKNKHEYKTEEHQYMITTDKELVTEIEGIRQETYSIINKEINKLTGDYKGVLKSIIDYRNAKGEIRINAVNWGCSDCVVEAINLVLIPYLESQSYKDLKESFEIKKENKKKK